MSDRHFLWMVEAAHALLELNEDIQNIFHGNIEDGPYVEIFYILDILKANSRYANKDEMDPVIKILRNEELSMQERARLLQCPGAL